MASAVPIGKGDKISLLEEKIRRTPPLQRLVAFEDACRVLARAEPDFNSTDMGDRLYALAMKAEVVPAHSVDEVQRILADVVSRPCTPDGNEVESEEDLSAPSFSEEELALQFAELFANELRYVAKWKRWLRWNGVKWKVDDTLKVFNLARRLCRKAALNADPKVTHKIASASTVAAVERLARSDRRLAATVDQWDADPWLLNTPAGIVDLRTGKIRAAKLEDYATKTTAAALNGSMATPVWNAFLQRATGGNEDLIGFLQRISGYSLTGITAEHALFFLYGTGANGKSTFLNALSGCLGEYHRTAPMETFTASKNDRHPTELASLQGARLVTATETEEGRSWAEARIKWLTGGDPIAARFMRRDFFEFIPQFKLAIGGNYKPALRGVDEAMRRRFNLIPFTITVPPEERDKTLADRLKSEWPGILSWAIKGCLEWQRVGLAAPESVRLATAGYLESEDAVATWIEEECDVDPSAWESTTDLFASWNGYANRTGEQVGTLKRFRQRLENRPELDLRAFRRSIDGRRGFYGLRVKRPAWNTGQEVFG